MRALLEESFRAAVSAADPLRILPSHLPAPPRGRTLVAAAGKAAASMALAVERHWPRDAPLDGLAIDDDIRPDQALGVRRLRDRIEEHRRNGGVGDDEARGPRQVCEAGSHQFSRRTALSCHFLRKSHEMVLVAT